MLKQVPKAAPYPDKRDGQHHIKLVVQTFDRVVRELGETDQADIVQFLKKVKVDGPPQSSTVIRLPK